MILLPIHILAGLVSIAAGLAAVFAIKGQTLQRRSGMVFVYATGTVTAITRSQPFNGVAGVLTVYLVLTGLLTVRRPAVGARWIDLGAMLVALAVALLCGVFIGLELASSAPGERGGSFMVIYVIFGVGAVLAVIGDARTLLARRIGERRRLARHLRRMCFTLLIAVGSFFLGQAQVFPEPLRRSGLLGLPVLLVVVLMVYWLRRVSFTKWRPNFA